jgi:hypothetical protein
LAVVFSLRELVATITASPVFRTPPNGLGLAIHASLSKISNEIESSARAIGFRGRAVVEGRSIATRRSNQEGWTKSGGLDKMTTPIRIGAVSYLNAKLLYHRLCEFAPYVRLSMDVPSLLAEQLGDGELDVALIPSVEYLRGAGWGYEIIPGIAIAARGPVRSVKLLTRVPYDQIGRLALDAGSRTSQVLAQIWLDAAHGVRPDQIEELPLGVSALESTADAVLVIARRTGAAVSESGAGGWP